MNAHGESEERPLAGYLAAHPATAATAAYLYVSVLGSVYEWVYFRQFGVNIFDFAEANDFLLAAFRQPIALLLLVGSLLVYGSILLTSDVTERGILKLAGRLTRTRAAVTEAAGKGIRFLTTGSYWQTSPGRAINNGLWTVAFAMYSLGPMVGVGMWDAKRLKEEGELVCVKRRSADDSLGTVLVGTTERFVILYEPGAGDVSIVALSEVIEIRRPGEPGSCSSLQGSSAGTRQQPTRGRAFTRVAGS